MNPFPDQPRWAPLQKSRTPVAPIAVVRPTVNTTPTDPTSIETAKKTSDYRKNLWKTPTKELPSDKIFPRQTKSLSNVIKDPEPPPRTKSIGDQSKKSQLSYHEVRGHRLPEISISEEDDTMELKTLTSRKFDKQFNAQAYSNAMRNLQTKVLGQTSLAEKRKTSVYATDINKNTQVRSSKHSVRKVNSFDPDPGLNQRSVSGSSSSGGESMSKDEIAANLLEFMNRKNSPKRSNTASFYEKPTPLNEINLNYPLRNASNKSIEYKSTKKENLGERHKSENNMSRKISNNSRANTTTSSCSSSSNEHINTSSRSLSRKSPKTKVASLVSAFNSTFLPKSKSTKTASSPPYLEKSNSLPKNENVSSPPAKHSLMPSICTNYSQSTPSKQSSIASSSDSKPLTVSRKPIKQSVQANNQKITSASHNNLLDEDTKVHQKTHSFGEKKSSLRFSSSKFGSMTRDKSPNNNNMARSISISNFRTKHNNSAVVCKSPSSLNVSDQNLRKRVYSMPKLNQSDSLTRKNASDLTLPSDDEKVKLSESILEALPVTSPYYNLSASKARLLLSTTLESPEKSSTNIETSFPAKKNNLQSTLKESFSNAKTLSKAAETFKVQSTQKLKLIERIRTRIEELTQFREDIQIDIEDNDRQGEEVKAAICSCGNERDLQKFTLVVRDLEPTIGLFFSLQGRLDRCNYCLLEAKTETDKKRLGMKKDMLENQLHEARKIRERVEHRRNLLAERLRGVLAVDDYDCFISYLKHKVIYFEQQLKIESGIKQNEEQLRELRDSEFDDKG